MVPNPGRTELEEVPGKWPSIWLGSGWTSWELLPPDDTVRMTEEDLRRKSFFKPIAHPRLYDPVNGSDEAEKPEVRADVLAQAIPAMSWATGANPVPTRFGGQDSNQDMMTLKNGWPESRIASQWEERWIHGDFRDIAYFFVFRLYDNIVRTQGRLHE